MKDELDVKWAGNMEFEAIVDGHSLILDSSPATGGHKAGPRPKPLLMVSLAGCTGMDVISILKKMKIEPDTFNVHVEATLNEEHPKSFTAIHLIYDLTGENIPFEKVKHAVELSKEKYCGVSATLKRALTITYEIRINHP